MIEIREIEHTPSALRRFVDFGIRHYEGNDCFVPPLRYDDVATLRRDKNPAFDYCQAQAFMAYDDGKPVGRIVGIINDAVNKRTGEKTARFGFFETVDDINVSRALIEAVEDWAKLRGMTSMVGPMGFTDMDHEGMLIEGFDRIGTMATIYNHPWYPEHMERLGFRKETDWIEFLMKVPDRVPEKMERIAEIVKKKYGLRTVKFDSTKKLKDTYGVALFELINEAYDELYGYSPLTPRQIVYYIDMYLSFIRLDYVSCIVDADDRLVGVGISIPSLSKALQRSGGRMLPLGWYHLLRAIRGRNEVVDLLLVAIKKEYQGKGVNALLFTDLLPIYIRDGLKYAESNVELEDNTNVQGQWQYFEREQHKRRRVYRRDIP